MFSLSPEDAILVTKKPAATRVLLLQGGDSLLFVGTMQLVLLQGSIELLGVPLTPSKTLHQIFAPRSHPLPIISVSHPQKGEQTDFSSTNSSPSHDLPDHIRRYISPAHTVVLLQESPTGAEGLGHVMRPFKNVFEPDERDANSSVGVLRGLHIVSLSLLYLSLLQ